MVSYGLLGALLGLGLGVAGGLVRRSVKAGLMAGVVGLVLGGAAGVVMSMALVPLHDRHYDPDTQDMLLPLAIHAGLWGLGGLAGGLAFGLGLGAKSERLVRAAIGGLIGALFGTVVYELVGAIAFPLANTVGVIAQSGGARLLACAAVAIGTAIGAAVMLRPARTRPATGTPPISAT